MMKRSLLAGLGALALVTSASAADLPRANAPYAAPAFVSGYNWTGFYLGINAGGAWGRSSWDALAVTTNPSGGMIGVTAGYNWQGAGSAWVFGLEGDVDWTGINGGTATCTGAVCETKNTWLGTIRGRVGYAWDRILPYLTGGLAVGNIQVNRSGFAGTSETKAGWTLGAGVEAAIYGRLTGKLEYLYADLGSTNCSVANCGIANNVDLRTHILRAGLNWRF